MWFGCGLGVVVSIVGKTCCGKWEVTDSSRAKQAAAEEEFKGQQEPCALIHETAHETCSSAPDNLYVYEGQDYSRPSDADKKTFDQLLAGLLRTSPSHTRSL